MVEPQHILPAAAARPSPRVSVVVPTYNRARLLPGAIESALDQTFDDLEVIVADDGSDDSTEQVASAFGDRVQLLKLPHSGKPAAARNAALGAARGELVALLDSDDAWLPEKLERQLELLDRRPEVGLVCTNAWVIDANGRRGDRTYLDGRAGAEGRVLVPLLDTNFVIASTVLVRRGLVDEAGGFSEEPLLRAVEDYDLWLRLAVVTRFAYLPTPLALYREHAGAIRGTVPRVAVCRSQLRILDRVEPLLGRHELSARRALRRRRGALLVGLAQAFEVDGNLTEAGRSWVRAVRARPGPAAGVLLRRGREKLRHELLGLRARLRPQR